MRLCHCSQFIRYPRWALCVIGVCYCLIYTPGASAGNTFRYTAVDGSTVFSDVRAGGYRQYKQLEDTSRPTAQVSCNGQINSRLTDPGLKIQSTIDYFANRHAVNRHLIMAVAHIESCFDSKAISSAGAKGIMQLMPATANELGVTDVFNVRQNVDAGVRYLASLLTKFKGNEKLALAAYNAGPNAVEHYRGIPPYPETISYVHKVLQQYQAYSNAD